MNGPTVAVVTILLVATVGLAAPTGVSVLSCPGDTTPDFSDSCHHEYILYDVDQGEVDVLIVPSASPFILRDVVILEQSVNAWDEGINNMGPSWLASGLNLHPYSLGVDQVPISALWDPEIVIIAAEANPVLLAGIGLQAPASWCHDIPSPLSAASLAGMPGFHQHEGSSWGMLSAECESGGQTCFVVDTNFLRLPDDANRRDMFDLNSHELGHCLGIGHVGDATLDFVAATYPEDDIMSYESDGHDAGHVLCVSTLNIKALNQAYGDLLGQSGYPASPAGTYVHDDPANWAADSCSEPTAGYTDPTPYVPCDPTRNYCPCPPPFTGNLPPAGSGCVPSTGGMIPILEEPVCVGIQITDPLGVRTATASCVRDPTGLGGQTPACFPTAPTKSTANAQFICTLAGNNWCNGKMVEASAVVTNSASSATARIDCSGTAVATATANGLIAPLSQVALSRQVEANSGVYTCTLSFNSGSTSAAVSVAACQSVRPLSP